MPLTRLDNLLSSKTGKYIYVSPDDFNASDSLDNRGNSPLRPFVSIQRAFLEVGRYSYVPGVDNDRFDQFTIMLAPGTHYVDNRPGDLDTSEVPVFNYDSATDTWNDPAIFDLGNPNNILYRFNGRDGGTTIPRGTSLVGTDLRRTQVRALYLPDPADKDVPRCALFNVTGGCYFWQFTILDGNPEGGPLNGKVYSQPGSTQLSTPLYSHHKMTNFVFADKEDLSLLYRKISKVFSKYQTAIDDVYTAESGRIQDTWVSTQAYTNVDNVVFGGEAYKCLVNNTNKRPDLEDNYWERLSTISREFDYRIQENRIVGPLADTVQLDELVVTEPSSGLLDVTVRTKINHGFFPGQYVAIANTGLNFNLEGVFQVISISPTNPKEFKYRVVTTANAVGLIPGASITPNSNATVQAEVDSVESASPYVFNVSIRSTWGICGIWADGRKATGFKSMVIAQYTGVSLQKDDRAFIRYDEFSNTWNQAPLTDAFASTPYHIKGDAYWKDDWRNFHVRASDDSFIQNVSIFAVGFADHFLLESGGDMSITNSNSNFGNTSMHSKGYKGFAFNQDKGGYITDIIPPQALDSDAQAIKTNYYPIDVQLSKPSTNSNRLYLTGDKANNYLSRPAASINGYRLGARTYINDAKCEKLFVNTTADQTAGETGSTTKTAVVYPQGFKIWSSALDTLSPADLGVGDFNEDGTPNTAADTLSFNLRQDAANLIDANKIFIQSEAFGYILEKYPYLQTISYVNPNITFESGRYRDARNLILSNRQEIIDYAYNQMLVANPGFTPPSADKCKRDLGYVVDALAADLYDGGNSHMIEATKAYFDVDGNPISDGLVGEITQSVFAFNRARDWAKKAISNLLGNTSLVPVISLTSSGTTITASTSSAHKLVIGQEINVGGATQDEYNVYKTVVLATGFTPTQFKYQVAVAPSITTATGAFYCSTVTIDPENNNDPAGRYKDASALVASNRQEIIDRAFAEVSLQYNEVSWGTDWVVPGDSTTDDNNRFRDSYRLIQQNKQEIIDRAAAEIGVQYPDFYYPGDAQTTATSRFKDSYRLIQLNRASIVSTAYAAIAIAYPAFTNPNPTLCQRDIGYFIDAVSLDIAQGGGNRYTRKFIQNYFNNAGTSWIANGLQGEEAQSNVAFNSARDEMKKAITNQLAVKDLTLTVDPLTGSNTSVNSCADVRSAIDTLTAVITARVTAGNLTGLPAETTGTIPAGETKCKRDIAFFIDAVSLDIAQSGGNKYSRKFIQQYFTNATTPISGGLVGEEAQSVVAFNMARDMMKKALTNQLYSKDLTLSAGPATYGGGGGNIAVSVSGNSAACADVRSAVDTLTALITARITAGNLTGLPAETTGTIPAGETKCKRDLGYILDSIQQDLYWGGNEFTVGAIREYFGNNGLTSTGSLNGEIAQSVVAYDAARTWVKKAVTNQLYAKNLLLSAGPAIAGGSGGNIPVSVSGNSASCVDVQTTVDSLFGIITTTLNAGTLSSLPAIDNGDWDCANVRNTIDSLFAILNTALTTSSILGLPPVNPGPWSTVSESSKCRRDIGYIVEAITADLRLGGNENIINAAESYFTGTGQQTLSGNLASNGVITGLTSTANLLVGMALTKSSGVGAFGVNPTILSIDGQTQITVTQTSGSVTPGAISFVANQLDYIERERVETLDAYDYVRNLAISSMRNHNTYVNGTATGNSPVITVPSTTGLVVGMKVRSVTTIPTNTGSLNVLATNYNDELEEISNGRVVPKASNYTTSIPSTAYIMKIGDGNNGLAVGQIQLGTKGSRFDSGVTVNASGSLGTNTPVKFFFQLEGGVWTNSIDPSVDLNVIQDYNYTATYGECSSVVENINTFFTTFNTVINNGIGSVSKKTSNLNTGSFAKRATLFTLTDSSAGAAPTDPHHLETGTPVRLVPRAKEGVDVDKRLIRLPRGFNTNTIYYVIAPGRKTDPYDYSNTTRFDGTTAGSFQNLMLASSAENAATGIYIYSSETESIDENVVIDVYQYVLDVAYDLNQYTTRRGDGTTLVSEEPHVFDKPNSSWNRNDNQKFQAIFFKPIGNGSLPTGISSAREYYARYVNKSNLPVNCQFEVYDTLTEAIAGATPISFPAFGGSFYTLSSKKRSPLRFAPEAGAALSYDETRLYVNDKTVFSVGNYVKVDQEFFFVTGISTTGADHLVVTRASLGTYPVNHSVGATVIKWSYGPTVTTTTLTETVDLVETILDFTSVTNLAAGDYVRLSNSLDALTEVVKIVSIEGTQVIVLRAQLGTVVQQQTGTVTATKLSLAVSAPSVTTTLTEGYPRLLTAEESGNYAGGTWYIATDTTRPNTILERMRRDDFATKDKTPDTWFERIEDTRTEQDRVYRLRYVIPNYLKAVRDPLRGFVIKSRNDQTRRLLPQKILVKPTGSGANVAELSIPNQGAAVTGKAPNREYLGFTTSEHGPNFASKYDPYNPETLSEIDQTPKYRTRITTDSKVTFYVQSARRKVVNASEYLELTVFNVGIEEQGYKEKLFTTVKIDSPQGGTGRFVASIANLPAGNTSNIVTWDGGSKGRARVHAYFSYENQNYMILKDITVTSSLSYDANDPTVFTQGSVTSTLIAPPNEGRSDLDNYLYVIEGANVYTMTPGDTFQAENGNYTIASVEDTEDFDTTFYIYDINEIRRRIYGQQDGIYYLTCLRGDIRPFPTGAGVGENFRNYKFSQPVSKLYPEFYKNDPEWYKQLDAAAIDPPATVSAADNYIHGLVTVNESKSSVTREGILDLVKDPGSKVYTFTGDNAIQAQSGGASAGSEARRIPICGDSQYPTEGRIYVELRRPSIARSGNHTFEYLGFGPGNYSTGFPARQEVVLSDVEDFYAQAKRENGGIVFYTGLNSNGDLYIGNRKINAITGEETFLESAKLVESQDQGDTIGNFVTTFDGPVTFNDIVSFLAPLNKGPNQWTSPIYMDVGTIVPTTGFDAPPAIQIKANIATNDDASLRINPATTRPTGDIILTDNRLQVAVIDFNTRGLQDYSIRTALNQVTPDQLNVFGALSGSTTQVVGFGSKYALRTGDILLKGEQVGLTGSIAWVYGNNFETVTPTYKYQIQGFGAGNNKVRITWAIVSGTSSRYTNSQAGIKSANYQVKITGTFQNSANSGLTSKVLGAWSIIGATFSDSNNYVDIQLNNYVDVGNYDISAATEPTVIISVSNVAWKEVGVIGAESIRTNTDDIGDYKVGINTVARAAHTAYKNGFVESGATDPRANFDIVGTTFISGKTLATSPNNFIANPTLVARTFINQDNALLVGGDSANPNNAAVFRLSTTNSGRVGINTTNAQLNGSADAGIYNVALAVIGNSTISGSVRIQTDLAVNGGDITTTVTTADFNIFNQNTFVGSITDNAGIITTTGLNLANYAAAINIGTSRTSNQYITVGGQSTNSNIKIGNTATTSTNVSKVNIGGAFNNNESNSYVSFDSKLTRVGGDLALSYLRGLGSSLKITVPTGSTLDAFNEATVLNLANNASTITFGGQGGNTKVRNALTVDASLSVNGNTILNGGLSSFDFNGNRAQLGTSALALTGQAASPIDKPVDLVTIVNGTVANATYFVNQVDTPGSGDWGGISFQAAVTNIIGSAPNNLPALTGNQYYLPLLTVPTYSEGDYLLIDTNLIGSKHPEIVKIPTGGLVRTGSAPYYIIVERQPLGTFTPTRTDHNDLTFVRKLNIALDATWVTNNLTSNAGSALISLSEFGGQLGVGDYIILQRNSAGTVGEFVKIASTATTNSRKFRITDGGAPALTVFEVDSLNGNTTIGSPSLANSGNLSIYGSITLQGGCGNGSTTTDRALKFRNELYETVNINTCSGDVTFGSQYATVFVIGTFFATAAANHSTTTPVYVYRNDPFARQQNGPLTTIVSQVNPGTWDIPVQSISGFSVGDLVLISTGTALGGGGALINPAEIIKITSAPYTSGGIGYLPTIYNATYPVQTYPNGGRGQETTSPGTFAAGATVVKIKKDFRTTTLGEAIPATGRTPVELPNTLSSKIRIKLVNGDLVAEKLDNAYLIRIDNEFFYPDSKSGAVDPAFGVRMPKSYRDPVSLQITNFFGGGKLTINDDLQIQSGSLRILGSDGYTPILVVANDDGHPGDGSLNDPYTGRVGMYFNGNINNYGKLSIYDSICQEYGTCTDKLTFDVDNTTGSLNMGQKLYIEGKVLAVADNSLPLLHIDNIGSAGVGGATGPRDFIMYQDGAIDAFGIKQYFTSNGGRRWTYVAQSLTGLGQTQTNPLQPNNNYIINCSSGSNTVLYLPDYATTGDIIRFIEVSGNLQFNTNLVIRALKISNVATAIQGDITGSKINAGAQAPLGVAWDSGELIVQTRNASFGLLFVGQSDAPGDPLASEIPANLRGWWLMEL
jgi:hypothetical protein